MNERELFEAKFPIPAHWIEFDEKRNKYFCPYVADGAANEYQARWEAWQASANRQGYKLVPVEPTPKMIDATWDMDEQISWASHNDRNEIIYKAMISKA